MWAIRKFAAALGALMLLSAPALAAPRYNTREAQKTDFSVSSVFDGAVIYQQSQMIVNYASGTSLSEVLVEEGQTVSAGDTVATYVSPVTEVDIARAETALSQAQDDYDYEISQRSRQIAEYREASANAGNPTDARIYELQAQREELLLTQYAGEAEAELAALTAQRDAALASGEPKPIGCSIDGVVYYVTNLDPGSELPQGREVAGVVTPESMIIRVDNSGGALKYGMRVDMRLESSSGQQYVTGTVVSCDNVLPAALRSGVAYIVPDSLPGAQSFRSVTVTAETLLVEGVTVVSNQTLQYQNGRCYVRILDEDGAVRTRYVKVAMSGGSDSWIILGVEPGDKLIAK